MYAKLCTENYIKLCQERLEKPQINGKIYYVDGS